MNMDIHLVDANLKHTPGELPCSHHLHCEWSCSGWNPAGTCRFKLLFPNRYMHHSLLFRIKEAR